MKQGNLYNLFNTVSAKICLVLLLLFPCLKGAGQNPPSGEYKVKAAFLFNFTGFVEWPPEAFDSAEAPFVITIVGEDPFGSLIDELVKGEKVKGHSIIVTRLKLMTDLGHCHMLFINTKELVITKEIIAGIPTKILTVSDAPDFNLLGGMIRLAEQEHKIKLIINPAAIKAAELVVSSKLLSVAEIFVR